MVAVHSARHERRAAGQKNDANANRGFDMSTNIDPLDITTPQGSIQPIGVIGLMHVK